MSDIKAELSKPLVREHVKERTQSGRKLSYIEGWWAIAEANRIFGFDGWTRETVEVRCVAEGPRKIGQAGVPGHGVTYVAKVRVTALGVVREGFGTGHGVDRDLGLAHESAIKEAETDAMKRALMTFGNPFGLALYDKTQANVVDDPGENPGQPVPPPGSDAFPGDKPRASSNAMKREMKEIYPEFEKQMRAAAADSGSALVECKTKWRKEIKDWPEAWRNSANALYEECKAMIIARYRDEDASAPSVVWDDTKEAAE